MKQDKLPSFLIGGNPMARPGIDYITHTRNPFFVAQIVKFDNLPDCLEYEANMKIGGRTLLDGKYYVVDPVFIIKEGNENVVDPQHEADKMAKLFRRAADWVHSYFKNLDQGLNNKRDDITRDF